MTDEARGGTLKLDTDGFDMATTMVAKDSGDSEPRTVDPSPVSFDPGGRYSARRVLGAGGMGEVRLCGDAWVGREVAMKVMRSGTGSQQGARARFLREARVQGQLEHPSVVPVYDIGRDEGGQEFFTMKRVKGDTLEEIISALRRGDPEGQAKYGRRKLLSAMSQVCNAVAYAHNRGVIHRDLKPANIMLGDFGEVYVLDWGIARIRGAADIDAEAAVVADTEAVPETQVGSVVGTPGYMSPEQARGETNALTPASDVYALGAILFELLSLEALHRGKSLNAVIGSTLTQAPIAPSRWAPDRGIPPELDDICMRSTAIEPEDRFDSARALFDAIEAYLDGERDAERRRELIEQHLANAREALADGADKQKRVEGLRELTRAIALDPTDSAAVAMISDWVLGATDELSPEAEAELKAVELADRRSSSQRSVFGYASWFIGFPLALWMGVKSWLAAGLMTGALSLLTLQTFWIARTGNAGPTHMRRNLILNFVVVGILSTLLGPFVLTPGIAMATSAAYVVSIRANRQTRWLVFGLAFCSVFVPAILGWLGILPPSYLFEDGVLKILPVMLSYTPMPAEIMLVTLTFGQLVLPALILGRSVEALTKAERQNFAQAWRLRQLLPQVPTQPSLPPPAKCIV